ncbi:short-chain dehydrogenase/reductase [Rouxiella silvae]|uniref:SDR family oxidoreductase n=1 Tax=Rouxiella silvae TaxID=1646373 RepID=A0AA41BWB3_9GAMM|nr:SDR family oxidoreductase [Rouxiella silvae]KQN51987.1 short-chain dehydrogenase [Serratia sp. Leaf50]MBF6637065.1 SDR family oxidoreductase [Rouxiella silvae]ORJ19042.1 short-chain dehydrogenase/reductase [Rouxiella silvae]
MQQRIWFITGVNSGFGRHMTEQLLAHGECVAGTTRDMAALAKLKARYGNQLWLAELDLTDTPSIHRVVNQAFSELGKLDVIVSNAGYGLFGAAEEMTDEQILHQINTNLLGSIQLVRAALPHLRRQQAGRIIQLSSVGGQAVFPGGSLYHATKWGIEGFIDSLRLELAAFNIGCTLIEPGSARTDFRFRSAKLASKIDAYDASAISISRQRLTDRSHAPIGDPAKMASIMIASASQHPAPARIALGSDAYHVMHQQLSARLAALEEQKDLAFSTDYPVEK